MKSLQRYLCVLLCLLTLLGVSSASVSAEELKEYQIDQGIKYPISTTRGYFRFYPNNGTEEKTEKVVTFANSLPDGGVVTEYQVKSKNNDTIFEGGRKISVNLNNVYYSVLFTVKDGDNILAQGYVTEPLRGYVHISYADNTSSTEEIKIVKRSDKIFNLEAEFTPTKDIQHINFVLTSRNLYDVVPYAHESENYTFELTFYWGEYNGDDKYQFSFEVSSEEAGLLSGLIEWVKGIFNSVSEGFDNIKNGITNIVSYIIELPQKIWSFIEEGLKSLFVPDQADIHDFKEDVDALLASKLGAVYQVSTIMNDFWNDVMVANQTNSINMPKVSIPVGDGETFEFGGYNVTVVPNGFETIVDAVKIAISAICTIAFIGGIRKRYEEVMGVEK